MACEMKPHPTLLGSAPLARRRRLTSQTGQVSSKAAEALEATDKGVLLWRPKSGPIPADGAALERVLTDLLNWLLVDTPVGDAGDGCGIGEHKQAVFVRAFIGEQLAVVLVTRVVPDALSCLKVEVEKLAVVSLA